MTTDWSRTLAVGLMLVTLFHSATGQARCSKKSDLVFVIDQSGSIEDNNPKNGSWDNWKLIQQFINTIIMNSEVSFDGTHFALITFGNEGIVRFYLTDHLTTNSLVTAVNAIPFGQGQTNLYAGLHLARTQVLNPDFGARLNVPRIIVVITDGFANVNTDLTLPEAAACIQAGIIVFSVGITSLINENQLMNISSPPHLKNFNYWVTPDYTTLSTILASVANATCDPPKNVLPDCQVIDLAFAIDIPNAASDFMIVKGFLEEFITLYIPVSPAAVRVSVSTFDSVSAKPVFLFSNYSNEDDVKAAIATIPWKPSNPGDPSFALELMLTTVFASQNGARQNNISRVLVLMLNNALPNRNAAISAVANLHAQGNIRVITVGMNSNVLRADMNLLVTANSDVISSVSYLYLSTRVQTLSTTLCSGNALGVACPAIADIVLILDQSTSIVAAPGHYDNWNSIIGFASSIAQSFPISRNLTRVGVLMFSTSTYVAFPLDQYFDAASLNHAILNLDLNGGETNISGALRDTREIMFSPANGARVGIPQIAILVTDGHANINTSQTVPEATKTKSAGIQIFTVGITTQVDVAQLQVIASYPPETHFFYVGDYSELNSILNDLVARSCETLQTSLNATTTSPGRSTLAVIPENISANSSTTPTSSAIASTEAGITITSVSSTPVTTTPSTSTAPVTPSLGTTPTISNIMTTTPTAQGANGAQGASSSLPIAQFSITTSPADTAAFCMRYCPNVTTGGLIEGSNTSPGSITSPLSNSASGSAGSVTQPNNATAAIPTLTTPTATTTVLNNATTTGAVAPASSSTASAAPIVILTPSSTIPPRAASSANSQNDADSGRSCRKRADVVFLIDRTSNMNYNFYVKYLIGLIQAIVTGLSVDDGRVQVAAITFSDSSVLEFNFSSYARGADVNTALTKIEYGGYTADLASAIRLARTDVFVPSAGARSGTDVSWIAIAIVDNRSNNETATLAEADLLRKAGVTLVTVGCGTYLDMYELAVAASYPFSTNSFIVGTAMNLSQLVDPIHRIICSDDWSCDIAKCGPSCVESKNTIQCTCPAGITGLICDKVCSNGGDIVFAVATSSGKGLPFVQALTSFAARVASSLDLNGGSASGPSTSRVGLVTYGNTATVRFNLNTYAKTLDVLQALNAPAVYGQDNLAAAIEMARDQMFTASNGDRPDFPNYLVIIMDGSSSNQTAAWLQAMTTRAAGISIIVVDVNGTPDLVELSELASAPTASNILTVSDVTGLTSGLTNQVVSLLCKNTKFCASNPCQNGATCTEIVGGFSCAPCPPSSTGFFCERSCSGVIDLVFLLHDAMSIEVERFPLIRDFVIRIVQDLDMGPNRTRVGLIYWSDSAYVGLSLNQYTNQQDVIAAIRLIPYLGGRTNTAAALRLLRTAVFTPMNGDRSEAPNVVVLIANADSTVDSNLTVVEAIQARISGTTVITVGLEKQMTWSTELETLTSFPRDKNRILVPSFSALANYTDQVVQLFCRDEKYCNASTCQNGGTCQEIFSGYICNCPKGVIGINCEGFCSARLDVVLMLDISGSVQDEYDQSVAFARRVVNGLDINSDSVRVGALAFSDDVVGQFFLNTYAGQQHNVINAMDFYNEFSHTNTPAALTDVLTQQFTAANGDRPDVSNVLVIVTDGYSNIDSNKTIPNAQLLKNEGVIVYVIAVGDSPQMSELNGMASDPPSQYVIPLQTLGSVISAAVTLLANICHL